jgi:hypothetical protein
MIRLSNSRRCSPPTDPKPDEKIHQKSDTMTQPASRPPLSRPVKMSLPYRFLYEGMNRVGDLMRNDRFTFKVNGKVFDASIAEAVILSPTIPALLEHDRSVREFRLEHDEIEADDFGSVLSSIRGISVQLLRSREVSLLKICDILENFVLESLFRSGFCGCTESIVVEANRGFDGNVNVLASQFYSYSVDDLRGFSVDLLDAILSNDSLQLATETALLNCILELGSEFRSLLRHIRVEFLDSSGLRSFVQGICVSDLDEALLSSIGSGLLGLRDDSLFGRRIEHFCASRLLSTCDRGAVRSVLGDLRSAKFELLYRGSRDGFKMSDIHRVCDGHCRTLTVIESTKLNIFGGYTPLAWQSSGGYQRDASLKSFLFSVKNPRDSIMRRFPVKEIHRF